MASVDIFARTEGCQLQIHVERDGPLAELASAILHTDTKE